MLAFRCLPAARVTSAASAIAVFRQSRRRRSINMQRRRCARNIENAFNGENGAGSIECATCRSGPRTLPAGNRASIIDFTTAALKRQAGGAATPSAASVETRSDNPASAMKASETSAMFGRSMAARRPGPSDSRRSRQRWSRRLYPAGCGPSASVCRGAKPAW